MAASAVTANQRRRRTRRPALSTIEEQQQWVERWCLHPGRGGISRAEQLARRQLRSTTEHRGDADTDDMASAAVAAAYRRISQRLDSKGAIEESGRGFRGYCRVVLLNEVRRRQAAATRRHARQIQPGEAVSIPFDDALTTAASRPAREVSKIMLEVHASPYKRHADIVQRHETAVAQGLLEIDADGTKSRVRITELPQDGESLALSLSGGGRRLRIANHTVVGLHVVVALIGYETIDGGQADSPNLRRVLLDSRRGVGLVAERAKSPAATADGRPARPWATAIGRAAPATPRRIPPRTFDECSPAVHPTCGEVWALLDSQLSSVPTGTTRRPWLAADHVDHVARAALVAARAEGAEPLQLVCALAEWCSPGLHSPFRGGHPGGHPLTATIHDVIDKELESNSLWKTPKGGANARSQACSRLSRRVQTALSLAGMSVHRAVFVIPEP